MLHKSLSETMPRNFSTFIVRLSLPLNIGAGFQVVGFFSPWSFTVFLDSKSVPVVLLQLLQIGTKTLVFFTIDHSLLNSTQNILE